MNYQTPRGTYDILPEEIAANGMMWNSDPQKSPNFTATVRSVHRILKIPKSSTVKMTVPIWSTRKCIPSRWDGILYTASGRHSRCDPCL